MGTESCGGWSSGEDIMHVCVVWTGWQCIRCRIYLFFFFLVFYTFAIHNEGANTKPLCVYPVFPSCNVR